MARTDSASPNLLRWILIGVFLMLAVAVFFVWRNKPLEPDIDAGRAAADAFLELVRKGQAAQAWDSTTAEFKSFEGRESFVKSMKKHPELLKPTTFVSVQTVTVQDSPRAEYLYRAADRKGSIRLLAGFDQNAWKIDRMKVE